MGSGVSDSTEILWSWGPGESRLAVIEDARPVELIIDRPGRLLDCVFLGRVGLIDKRLDAAFVDLGAGDRPGFLSGAAALGLGEGDAVRVQVRAEGRGGKGPKLSTDLRLPDVRGSVLEAASCSRAAPALLWRPHALERLLAAYPGVGRIRVDDAAAFAEARALFPHLAESYRQGPLFELYDTEDAFETALSPVVPVGKGGRLVIEPAAALTAVDVDAGAGRPADINRAAVDVLARQLRLRGIGGQIVVDFISGGGKGPLYRLAAALKKAVAADPVPTHVFGVTPLGLVEMTRERRGLSLAEMTSTRGQTLSAESVALAGLRKALAEGACRPSGKGLTLVAAPEVVAALTRLPEALAETSRRLGQELAVRSEAGRMRDDVLIEETRP